jgi:hypothetical protein
MKSGFFVTLFLLIATLVMSQQKDEPIKVIEFSGKVVYEDEKGNPAPLPYTNVSVKGTNRGAFTEFDGFFALVALAGETVVFSRIGYQTVEVKIPEKLIADRYTWVQIMTEDNYLLPEAVIMPWPSKEHFKQEFLAIDISNELRENAMANLADEKLKEIRYSVPSDGRETSSLVLKQQATDYVYTGQTRPMNVFNPIAWKNFIDAWRRGDFKKKK